MIQSSGTDADFDRADFDRADLDRAESDRAEFDRVVLDLWRKPGRALVADQWRAFHALLDLVRPLIRARRYAQAAAAAQVAANHAVLWHPGLFHSPELEQILKDLGRAALPCDTARPGLQPGKRSVLHVASRVGPIGGHLRMMAHWIEADQGSHARVALTRQQEPVPDLLRRVLAAQAATQRVGSEPDSDPAAGDITVLNRSRGGLLDWARALQAMYARADMVVLHVHNMDILPFLALAGMAHPPPVILLNHADHLFITGSGMVDLMVNTRHAGWRLCRDRRGIEAARNAVLPLCLKPPAQRGEDGAESDRAAARQALGLAPETVVILTIARGVKFRTIGATTFADTLLPVLKDNPHVHLIAVGPGGQVDWSKAEAAVPGQITVHRERPDTARFLAAADIYVDSFPFVSITSMFEAGLHSLPLATRYPFGPGCDVLGSDSPGLDGVIRRCCSLDDFHRAIRDLIGDPDLRQALGARTQAMIREVNMGPRWRAALEGIYDRAQASHAMRRSPDAAPDPRTRPQDDPPRFDDLDLISPFIYGDMTRGATAEARLAFATEIDLKAGPAGWRWRTLARLWLTRRLQLYRGANVLRNLLPEWLGLRWRSLGWRWRAWRALPPGRG